ncbi:hypothetical protein PENSPDRAFT_256 [Peniophora sp. CONT]|nr:hypothetical protein PENSPDRAFT_256 [Peniophora sp. CONT]
MMQLYSRFTLPLALAVSFTTLVTILYTLPSFSVFALQPAEWKFTEPLSHLPAAVVGPLRHIADPIERPKPAGLSSALGVASRIYVVSLPRRADRRREMDKLAGSLGLNFTYVDAVDASDLDVATIMDRVRTLRFNLGAMADAAARLLELGYPDLSVKLPALFDWPDDLEDAGMDTPGGAELWTHPGLLSSDSSTLPPVAPDSSKIITTPLACHTENNVFGSITEPSKPQHILDLPKLGCWHSHMHLLRRIADDEDERPSIVLEDDVNVERDIRERLQGLWDALPTDWDIVYLGHCWSNEAEYPAIRTVTPPWLPANKGFVPSMPPNPLHHTSLHPASGPKCTHAYALSRHGARRLLAHLRHPPFAYSRAIDQAMAWLVRSGRMRAFSIVPPVVVQRKVDQSDLMPGNGSKWRDTLYDGVLR